MPNSVRYYDSTMSGAPSLSGTAGALLGGLDACLVAGFGSVTIDGVDGLVVASDVATATVSAGHQFTMQGNTGPVITISGANPSGLNGEWRVTVTSTTEFTFATSGISDQTASIAGGESAITAKRSGAGFSRPFEDDVNYKAVYRSDDVTGTRLFCRIDDNYTTYSRICGYEAMDDVDTVTEGWGMFPTDAQFAGGLYVYKANAANRAWTLFSDGRMIYFFCDATGTGVWHGGFCFGDINSYVSPDAYGCVLTATLGSSDQYGLFYLENFSQHSYLARGYTQVGTSLSCGRYSHQRTNYIGSGGQAYPSMAGNSLQIWPVEVWDTALISRGELPGLFNPIHTGITLGIIHENLVTERTLISQTISTYYACFMDITGPWR